MAEIIGYKDLFAADLDSGLQGLVARVGEVESSLTKMLESVKQKAKEAGNALQGGGDISALSAQIDKLAKQFEKYTTACENLSKAKKKMQDESKNEESANKAEEDSIKALREEIKKLKTELEAMSEADREGSAEAKVMKDRVKELDGIVKNYENSLKSITTATTTATTACENLSKAKKKMQDESAQKEYEGEAGSIKSLRQELKDLIKEFENMSASQRLVSNRSDEIRKRIGEITKVLDNHKKNLKSITTATTTATAATKQDSTATMTLTQAYSTLNDLLEKTGVDVNQLGLSQKAVNSALKNGEIAANSATGSYNQLYAQYNLCKAALNAMSDEMRNNTNVGKVWEAESLRIMDTLKAMQANTGNYTLSVGNYEKALNGLNISTQQVLREMPTLANSFSLFIIAISNNVPIFIDNFKRAAEELGGFKKAVSATITSVFSWQTALLALLTILPGLIRKLKEKKEAQKEDNDVMREAYDLTKLLADAEKDAYQEVVNMTNELSTLYSISQDNNRSMEDRIAAGERLKELFEDELSNYSAEEIALGNAKVAVDELTNSLVAQAQARAYLSEIGELSVKLYGLETTQKKNQEAIDAINESVDKSKKKLDEYTESVFQASWTEDARLAIKKEIKDQEKDLEKAKETYDETAEQIAIVNKAIEDLKNRIDPSALAKDADGTSKIIKDEVLAIPDYYWEMLETTFGLLEDGLEKELALYDLTYAKESESRERSLKEMEDMLLTANANEREEIEVQMAYLRKIIAQEEQLYIKGRENLINEHITTIEEIEEEGAAEEEKIRNSINIKLKGALESRNSLIYAEYEKGNIIKAELDRELRESEKQYWSDYLKELRENEVIIPAIYNDIMAKLAKEEDKNARKNARKNRLRNIVEVGFALSDKTGETDPDTGKRKVKDEYVRFADAVNAGLEKSMDYMDEWMDKRIEMADVAIEQAKREAEIAKEQLDYEQQARANGYANNVEMARKEYEEQLALQRKAEKEKEKLQKAQELIDTAQQLSSLVTAVAEIWSAYGGIPVAGPIIAAAVTATMFGAFAAAKIQAAKVAKATTYGEGMVEYLDYGGSHASGNDIDFGVDKKGRRRRVERGEMIGVINKRNVDKYGVSTISGIFNSLNKGTYKSDVVDSVNTAMLSDMYGMSFIHDGVTDLSILEQGVQKLVAQNETKVVSIPNGRIEYKGNSKRIIYTA